MIFHICPSLWKFFIIRDAFLFMFIMRLIFLFLSIFLHNTFILVFLISDNVFSGWTCTIKRKTYTSFTDGGSSIVVSIGDKSLFLCLKLNKKRYVPLHVSCTCAIK